ncbi:MAG: prepilin-type cleavage/methylation domain-containing protein [Gammaproteobacteria bacterium]|nr:MAG: prepilin-type cleavage/methylation domain-containing protein [Gammaproteobacteria bacterium]
MINARFEAFFNAAFHTTTATQIGNQRPASGGFTLIELIIVIVISGIIAAGSAKFISDTAAGYVATAARQGGAATGVVVAEKMSRELRSALPNSIRTYAGNTCIEFVPVLHVAKYLAAPVIPQSQSTTVELVNSGYVSDGSAAEYAVIYPVDVSEIYSLPVNSTDPSHRTRVALSQVASNVMTLSAAHQFPTDSPTRRVFVVSQPVSYCLNVISSVRGIYRYSGYGFNPSASVPNSDKASLLVNNVSTNNFRFVVVPATLVRNALVEFSFEIEMDNEKFQIDREVQIRNVP